MVVVCGKCPVMKFIVCIYFLFTLDVLVQTYVFLWNGDVMVTLIATTPQTNGTVHVSEEDFALINLL